MLSAARQPSPYEEVVEKYFRFTFREFILKPETEEHFATSRKNELRVEAITLLICLSVLKKTVFCQDCVWYSLKVIKLV